MYRLADYKDIDEIIALRILQQKENYNDESEINDKILVENTKNYLMKNLNKTICFFVKEVDEKLVAMCGIQLIEYLPMHKSYEGSRADICAVYTRVEHRKQGIQTELLKRAIEFAKEKKIEILELKATNSIAVNMYNKLGFKELSHKMRLELS